MKIQQRLGRMAWKTVDIVIELSEQQRMKTDPKYAGAVQRLRTQKCHFGDVELFNTRVMKSAAHPEGVDMGEKKNYVLL
jgi:transposase-like protein